MKERDLVGKTVISMADGAKVGTVKDLLFNDLDLRALILQGAHGEGLLPYESIGQNGPDAITIESYMLVDWNAGRELDPNSRSTHDLRKLSVVDAGGNVLGHMHDLTMSSTGHIEDIDVRTQGVFGFGSHSSLIPGTRVRALGADLITVDSEPTG